MRIDNTLSVNDRTNDRKYSAQRVIDVLDNAITSIPGGGGGGGGGGVLGKDFQTTSYLTTTQGSPVVYYTALAIDGVTILQPRTADGVYLILEGNGYTLYGYDQTAFAEVTDWLAVWDEGVATDFTSLSESFGAGLATDTGGGGSGLANANFTNTGTTSSLLTLNASTSIGDSYAWELDTVPRPEITATVTYGPLLVGVHHVKLTVTDSTDGSTDTSERDVDVAWVGEPITSAQNDAINGLQAPGIGLAQWPSLPIIGPWRNKNVLNDTPARIVNIGDGSCTLLMTTQDVINGVSGGYRAEMAMTTSYNAVGAGYPAAVADIDHPGNVQTGHVSGTKRFFRMEYMIPTLNADASATPTGSALQNSTNNFAELRGAASIASTLRATIIAGGPLMAIGFQPVVSGSTSGSEVYFDSHAVVYDTWQNYVFEYVLSTDSAVGYVRVFRDGNVTSAPAGADGQGRYFAQTAQTDGSDLIVPVVWCIEVYRTHAYLVSNPSTADQTIHYRNCRCGPTLASVMAV